ncbi:Flp pilus assembly complex ATPase component TadA [Candidatus Micrarchaeota archaeon]|nr:Flp pilus assembly complex ATPase component TadA [Candidatus Micrarchaeota archaeon]
MLFTTKIDEMMKLVRDTQKIKKKATYKEIEKKLKWNENSIEKIALILEKQGLVKTHYTIDMIRRPWITGGKEVIEPADAVEQTGKMLEEYETSGRLGKLKVKVKIIYSKEEKRPCYIITLPKISFYTRIYLEWLKTDVSKKLARLSEQTGQSETQAEEMKPVILESIKKDIGADDGLAQILAGMLLNEMFGLDYLETLIGDPRLEEMVINSATLPVAVYHRKFGWLKTNIFLKNEMETENYAAQIARKVGRQISVLTPILDARLGTGDRTNATLYPISAHGNTITLRLFSKNPWTMVSYLKKECNTMSAEMGAMLWQAMQYEMNIVIAGGTASGKTSALNGLIALVQPFQRLVTIEDTQELALPKYQWNWVPLVTRPPNPEGLGEITMLDLVVNALRMRPDRIVMGEIRRKKEAEVLFEAMHTGHSVYATMHADTGSQVLKRLMEAPMEIPATEVEDIHLLLVQYRDRRRNIRRTLELSEIIPGATKPELNRVFAWKARTDSFEMIKRPSRYNEQMNMRTGMTEKEIKQDMDDKAKILQWMANNGLDMVDDVGKVMSVYYSEPEKVLEAAKSNCKSSKVLQW